MNPLDVKSGGNLGARPEGPPEPEEKLVGPPAVNNGPEDPNVVAKDEEGPNVFTFACADVLAEEKRVAPLFPPLVTQGARAEVKVLERVLLSLFPLSRFTPP